MADITERLRDPAYDRDCLHRIAAAAEIERLRAGGCARDQRTTQWCAEAVEQRARAERAEAERDTLRALLRQLRGWDVLHSSHDGKYWREEIDAAL